MRSEQAMTRAASSGVDVRRLVASRVRLREACIMARHYSCTRSCTTDCPSNKLAN